MYRIFDIPPIFCKSNTFSNQREVWLRYKFLMMVGYVGGYLVLLYGYYVYLVPVWGYYGFLWRPNWGKVVEALIWVVIISWSLPISFCRPSEFYLHFQVLVPVLPMLVIYGAMGQPRTYIYAVIFSFYVMFLVVKLSQCVVKSIQFKPICAPKIKRKELQLLLLLIGYLVVVSIFLQGGMRYFNLSLDKVYVYRSAASSNLPIFYGYINSWTSKVIFPFAFLLAFITKEKVRAFLSIIGSILMFGLTSHKDVLFYPFAVILFYWIAGIGRRKSIAFFLVGYYFVVIFSLIDYWWGIFHGWMATLTLRRVIFVPALLNFYYYDFFSRHSFVYWAQSKITLRMVSYKYSLDVPHLIGLHYFGSSTIGANTGWLGSGYANAGIMGMVIYAALIGSIFSLLDAIAKFHDKRVIVAIFVAPMFAMIISSDLPAALLTHGTLIGLLLLMFFQTRELHNGRKTSV